MSPIKDEDLYSEKIVALPKRLNRCGCGSTEKRFVFDAGGIVCCGCDAILQRHVSVNRAEELSYTVLK